MRTLMQIILTIQQQYILTVTCNPLKSVLSGVWIQLFLPSLLWRQIFRSDPVIVWPGVSIHVERGETLDSVTQTLAQQPLASSEVSFFIVSPAWPGLAVRQWDSWKMADCGWAWEAVEDNESIKISSGVVPGHCCPHLQWRVAAHQLGRQDRRDRRDKTGSTDEKD